MSLNSAKTIRWGIIGCGAVTEVKSGPAYQQIEGFELYVVMRRDVEKLKDYADRHHVEKYYTNADELIGDKEVDAIYIATPPDSHMYYALKVAKSGKPCCIEKPIATNYKDSLAIYEAFKEKNIPLFVAYYRRSLPRFLKIKEWLVNNSIGEVRHINWILSRKTKEIDTLKKKNWRTDASIAYGGYFDDLASHGLDLFTFLLGDIKEAHGISTNQQNLYTAKDAITGCWIHEGGATGSGTWNFGASFYEDKVEIIGSKGKIQFSVFGEVSLSLKTEEKEIEVFIENPKHIQIYHVQNMKKQFSDKNYKHPSNGKTATHTAWVMDKILGRLV
ncbi:Gfo/Idh/MocA family oxidoreductase [Tenacibaculum sp. 190524A02b]|uniref:Gfo/Idh/MocA family protein n=1 Tax=Tenacibaculum vairaonense TaxID=3137860 RepID=UPI0031FB0136